MTDKELIEDYKYQVKYGAGSQEILNLINRQQAEIEQWKQEANRYQTLWCEDVQNARAEAIKEFADRLKNELNNLPRIHLDNYDYYVLGFDFIDNLVKEMVGEDK